MEQQEQFPQIKICGLTTPEDALACAESGADAIGCVFFPPSPRHVSDDQAREICAAVAGQVQTVGVFVNETSEAIMDKAEYCGLSVVQLHGTESPEFVSQLRKRGQTVIKALFSEKNPSIKNIDEYDASAYLVECGKGVLPGGNALTWDWGSVRNICLKNPFLLAGGLSPDNILNAMAAAGPDAVDVSSGVEVSPGKKNINKVRSFINKIRQRKPDKTPQRKLRRIF